MPLAETGADLVVKNRRAAVFVRVSEYLETERQREVRCEKTNGSKEGVRMEALKRGEDGERTAWAPRSH